MITRALQRVRAASLPWVLLAIIIGCTSVTVGCTTSSGTSDPVAATPVSAEELLEQRTTLGIPECPASDPDVDALADGLPDITLSCIGGDSSVRLAGLRGRPMVINLWAQWCDPCLREAPYLAEFAANAPEDVLMLGIDFNDPLPAEALDFAGESGWTWPQLVDPDKQLQGPLNLVGTPTTLFVTAEGEIAYHHVGEFISTDEIIGLAREHLGVE